MLYLRQSPAADQAIFLYITSKHFDIFREKNSQSIKNTQEVAREEESKFSKYNLVWIVWALKRLRLDCVESLYILWPQFNLRY